MIKETIDNGQTYIRLGMCIQFYFLVVQERQTFEKHLC